ncbi:Outer membrane protein assembly factor BamA [compost metagenome]
MGNVFDTNCGSKPNCEKVGLSGLASSVGLGVTWITALGPLSFSLAMPVKKPDEADTQVFQFSLGQTF